jgi:hypothetical protein
LGVKLKAVARARAVRRDGIVPWPLRTPFEGVASPA